MPRSTRLNAVPMQIFWFLPTHGDSRYLGTTEGARPVDLDYLKQIAVAADKLGYEGVLIPDRPLVRRPVGGRVQPDRRDAAAQVPGRGAAGAAPAEPGGAHGGDLRPALGRARCW